MAPKIIALKLNSISLSPANQKRMIHFVLATTPTDDPTKMIITVLPGEKAIELGNHATELTFGSASDGGGMLLTSVPVPSGETDLTVKVSLWIMQTRRLLETIVNIVSDLTSFIEGEGTTKASVLLTALESRQSFVLSNLQTIEDGLNQLRVALEKMEDKQLGSVIMDQTVTLSQPILNLSRPMDSGNGILSWSWVVSPAAAPTPLSSNA